MKSCVEKLRKKRLFIYTQKKKKLDKKSPLITAVKSYQNISKLPSNLGEKKLLEIWKIKFRPFEVVKKYNNSSNYNKHPQKK